jgi:hypothetical protein
MNKFWQSETYAIVKAMKARGNQEGLIVEWKDTVSLWAEANYARPDAKAVLAWLPQWQVRPFYTKEELAPLWPALAIAVGKAKRWPSAVKSPNRLEYELDFANLPRLKQFDRRYFIVERLHYWPKATIEEIENVFNG